MDNGLPTILKYRMLAVFTFVPVIRPPYCACEEAAAGVSAAYHCSKGLVLCDYSHERRIARSSIVCAISQAVKHSGIKA